MNKDNRPFISSSLINELYHCVMPQARCTLLSYLNRVPQFEITVSLAKKPRSASAR
jgi:hypothetical protein